MTTADDDEIRRVAQVALGSWGRSDAYSFLATVGPREVLDLLDRATAAEAEVGRLTTSSNTREAAMTTDDEIRDLAARATPGPWSYFGQGMIAPTHDPDTDPVGVPRNLIPRTDADAEFIVAAREKIPELLTAQRTARADAWDEGFRDRAHVGIDAPNPYRDETPR